MEIRRKSIETIQSQVASFADTKRDGLLNMGPADEVYAQLGQDTLASDVVSDDYLNHLRSMTQEQRSALEKEATLLGAYDTFKTAVQPLLRDSEDSHANRLGSGTLSDVHKIEVAGQYYVVRVVNPKDGLSFTEAKQRIVHDHLASSVAAEGIDGLEHVVAASYEDGVVISEFVEGKHIVDVSPDEISAIPDEHLSALIQTRLLASARGIEFDEHLFNVLYSPTTGFTDIDYKMGGEPLDLKSATSSALKSLSVALEEYREKDSTRKIALGETRQAINDRFEQFMRTHQYTADEIDFVVVQARQAANWQTAWQITEDRLQKERRNSG